MPRAAHTTLQVLGLGHNWNNIPEDFLSMREDHLFSSFLYLSPVLHYFYFNLIEL